MRLADMSEHAQYVHALIETAPGMYTREDVIKELRLAYDLDFRVASDAFGEVLAAGFIRAEIETEANGVVHRAGTYHLV